MAAKAEPVAEPPPFSQLDESPISKSFMQSATKKEHTGRPKSSIAFGGESPAEPISAESFRPSVPAKRPEPIRVDEEDSSILQRREPMADTKPQPPLQSRPEEVPNEPSSSSPSLSQHQRNEGNRMENLAEEQGESKVERLGPIEERLSEFKEEMHKEMTNMHVEMIRQFQIQIVSSSMRPGRERYRTCWNGMRRRTRSIRRRCRS